MEFLSKNKEVVYISVLGINFSLGKFEKLGVFDDETTDTLIKYLEKYNTEKIIFDCSSVVYKDDQKVFERFFNLVKYKDREIIFFNLEPELFERIKLDLKNSVFNYYVNTSQVQYFQSTEITSVGVNIEDGFGQISKDLKNNDIEILKRCAKDYNKTSYQLKSTSFWTNYFFDISTLFSESPRNILWIIARLCNRFRNIIRQDKSVLLISTSLYGTIISTLMKEVLNDSYKIETICFNRLGPDILINEVNIHRKDSYDYVIHVSDIIIGGTELKILKALLSLRKLSITHVFVIGMREAFKDNYFDSLIINSVLTTNEIYEDIYYTITKPELS